MVVMIAAFLMSPQVWSQELQNMVSRDHKLIHPGLSAANGKAFDSKGMNSAEKGVTPTWSKPSSITAGGYPTWIHWDDSTKATSIGTGGTAQFEIAARWDAAQIASLNGGMVTKIAFFPASEGAAEFNIRVWQGPDAGILLVDQPVPSVTWDQWNIIDVANPVPIDVTKELWIGLHVNATYGWPAGCDAGPAIAGYGDMIYYDSVWKSLATSYALDYNWNVQGYIEGPVCSYTPALGMISTCESINPATLTVWNGSVSTDWFNPGNWNFGVPGSGRENAWIPSGLVNYPAISIAGAVCHDIYIRDGASILGNAFLSISGLAYVERFVNHLDWPHWAHCNWINDTLAINSPADIHYLSSPVADAKDSTVEQDAVWRWQEPGQEWFWLHHSCNEPCKGPPWIWNPGIGYSVAPNEYWWCQTKDCPVYNTPPDLCAAPWKCQYYREFIGHGLNYGQIDVHLTYTLQPSGKSYPPGWNLLGNPYPSALDWFAVPTVNIYKNSACTWCDTTGGYIYTFGHGGVIPLAQGFMVQCGPGGGTVSFAEAARLPDNSPLPKSVKTSFLTLKVSNNVNSFTDETYIVFDPEAEEGLDLLDGTKLENLTNAPMICSVLPDSTSLAVNSLKSTETTSQVSVHFKAGVTGSHSINITGIGSINENTPLYLEDRKLDISQDIKENPVYTFTADPSDDQERFVLHFTPLGIKDFSQNNVIIYSYHQNVFVNVPEGVNGTVSVINLLGIEILSREIIPGKLNKIIVTGPTGYYLVRVVGRGDVSTKKVFIN